MGFHSAGIGIWLQGGHAEAFPLDVTMSTKVNSDLKLEAGSGVKASPGAAATLCMMRCTKRRVAVKVAIRDNRDAVANITQELSAYQQLNRLQG